MNKSGVEKVSEVLRNRVADAIVVAQTAKHAHWNVRGPNFISLHELFDRIHERLENFSDLLAERLAQLGGYVEGTCENANDRSVLRPYPVGALGEAGHLEAMSKVMAEFGELVRADIAEAATAGDADTADILTEVSRGLDKDVWLLESHRPASGKPAWARAGSASGASASRRDGKGEASVSM